MDYSPRLKDKYFGEIVPALKTQFNYSNSMQVPRLVKISLNQGLGTAITDKKLMDTGLVEMTMIATESSFNQVKKGHFKF